MYQNSIIPSCLKTTYMYFSHFGYCSKMSMYSLCRKGLFNWLFFWKDNNQKYDLRMAELETSVSIAADFQCS